MLQGTHRFPRQEQVVYGRPAVDALKALAADWGLKRLLVITTASLRDSLAKEVAAGLGKLLPKPGVLRFQLGGPRGLSGHADDLVIGRNRPDRRPGIRARPGCEATIARPTGPVKQ